jgi:ADP-heptose:LPS heptosyltransferase
MFNTPILFIIFNRPDLTEMVFNEIRKARPTKLFIAADGPRKDNESDKTLCAETRKIANLVDWPCEVQTLFRKENLGCGKAVSSSISWFFNHVERGIILEDDCLPDPSFFMYCQSLLEHYENDQSVMHIGGVNFQNGANKINADYYFSAISHVWGWASWRRAWNKYDFNLTDLESFKKSKKIDNYYKDAFISNRWLSTFQDMHEHKIDTWDYQWTYCIFNNNGVSIIPNENLISNIGFREDATHTSSTQSVYANAITKSISLPLKHDNSKAINSKADSYFLKEVDGWKKQPSNIKKRIINKLKSKAVIFSDSLLKNVILKKKHSHPNKSVLIQKLDAIGDYIITRNFFYEVVHSDKYKDHAIYLLANSRLKSLIDSLDTQLFKEVIYYDSKIDHSTIAQNKFYLKLRRCKFATVIHATYSRTLHTDNIVFYSGAPETIGYLGDTANISKEEKNITDQYYTQLIDTDKIANTVYSHEFEKQKIFFEAVLNKQINLKQPSISLDSKFESAELSDIVICPGAQHISRTWSAKNFAELLNKFLEKRPNYKIKIVCGPNEEFIGKQIIKHIKNNPGLTLISIHSIFDLVQNINSGQLIIANDSAPIHIAVALNKKAVCISNGNHYNRFVPYPQSIYKDLMVILPDQFNEGIRNDINFEQTYYKSTSQLNINKIRPETVFEACLKYTEK